MGKDGATVGKDDYSITLKQFVKVILLCFSYSLPRRLLIWVYELMLSHDTFVNSFDISTIFSSSMVPGRHCAVVALSFPISSEGILISAVSFYQFLVTGDFEMHLWQPSFSFT